MMKLRDFREKDIDDINILTEQAFGVRHDYALYSEFHNSWKKGFIVIENFWRVLGFAIAIRQKQNEIRLMMLAVNSKFRRRGIGTFLMREIIKRANIEGMYKIRLEVKVSNKSAIRFYSRFGFVITSRIPHYYDDGEDGFLMIL